MLYTLAFAILLIRSTSPRRNSLNSVFVTLVTFSHLLNRYTYSFAVMARPTLLVLAPAILLIFFANRLAPAIQARSLQCAALSVVFPRKVSYPNSARYAELSTSYFSGQENDIIPNCVLTPVSSKDVATAIKILAKIDAVSIHAQFAIRGGGHTPFAGSANIDRGVTIDLRSLDQIIVSPDGRMASIGGGARWGQVSAKLDSMGLAVAGGRVSNTGVGGLTTGGRWAPMFRNIFCFLLTKITLTVGGMSFFAPRKGWVCDNVKNYEVALANGQIVDANAQENRDLWIALRGGSNNFGVVTRFDMYTFPQGESWGGTIAYPISTVYQQIEAFAQLSLASDYDVYAAVIQSIGYSQATGYGVANILVYTKAVVNPPTFQPFTNLQPQLFSSMRLSNLTQLTDEQAAFSPNGLR